MNSTVVSIKIDPQTKQEAQKTAQQLGVPLSVLIKGFLKQLIRNKSVTFSANDDVPNARLQAVMKQAEKNLKSGNHSPILRTEEDLLAWFDKNGI